MVTTDTFFGTHTEWKEKCSYILGNDGRPNTIHLEDNFLFILALEFLPLSTLQDSNFVWAGGRGKKAARTVKLWLFPGDVHLWWCCSCRSQGANSPFLRPHSAPQNPPGLCWTLLLGSQTRPWERMEMFLPDPPGLTRREPRTGQGTPKSGFGDREKQYFPVSVDLESKDPHPTSLYHMTGTSLSELSSVSGVYSALWRDHIHPPAGHFTDLPTVGPGDVSSSTAESSSSKSCQPGHTSQATL